MAVASDLIYDREKAYTPIVGAYRVVCLFQDRLDGGIYTPSLSIGAGSLQTIVNEWPICRRKKIGVDGTCLRVERRMTQPSVVIELLDVELFLRTRGLRSRCTIGCDKHTFNHKVAILLNIVINC